MYRLLLSMLFVMTASLAFAQSKIVESKGKFGVKNGDVWVIKPKFAKVVDAGEGYFGVQKSGKWGVYKPNGEVLLKVGYTEPEFFQFGLAYLRDKKGRWLVMKTDGSFLYESLTQKPIRYGQYLHILSNTDNLLINNKGEKVVEKFHSIKSMGNDLFAARTLKVVTVKYRVSQPDVTRTDTLFTLFSKRGENVYAGFERPVRLKTAWKLLNADDQGYKTLISLRGDLWAKDVSDCKFEDGGYLIRLRNDYWYLSDQGKVLVPNDGYRNIRVTKPLLWAKSKTGAHLVFDREGKKVAEGLELKDELPNSEFFVVSDGKLRWIVDGKLNAKCEKVPKIGIHYGSPLTVVIERPHSFRYFDPKTLEPIGGWLPHYWGTVYYGGQKRLRHVLTGRSPSTKKRHEHLTEVGNWSEGLVVVPLRPKNSRSYAPTDSIELKDESYVQYNFMKQDGSLLTTDRFSECWDFQSGKTFVRMGEKHYAIDSKGQRIDDKIYSKVVFIDGYYHVQLKGKWGVLRPDLTVFAPIKYDITHIRNGVYYGRIGREDFELYKID